MDTNKLEYAKSVEEYRKTLRQKLLADYQYRLHKFADLIFHTLRLLVMGFIVFPGVLIVGSLLISSLHMIGGLASVIELLITSCVETSAAFTRLSDYQSGATIIRDAWFIFGIMGITIALFINPWKPPMEKMLDDVMTELHASDMNYKDSSGN